MTLYILCTVLLKKGMFYNIVTFLSYKKHMYYIHPFKI